MYRFREHLKSMATYAPTELLEIVTNYSVLRQDGGRLLPPESVTGSKTVLYERVHRLVVGEQNDRPILFLEFGVYKGNSIRRWAGLNTHPESRFVGFDSFEGLPTKWRQRPAGHFSTDGQVPTLDDPRVSFVKGWFNQTVPGFLDGLKTIPAAEDVPGRAQKIPGEARGVQRPCPGGIAGAEAIPGAGAIPVIHIDADLYTSAIFLLTQLHHHFGRYHVLFDNYAAGEARALHAYLTAYGAQFQSLLGRKRRRRSRVPNQAFGLLTTNRPRPRK